MPGNVAPPVAFALEGEATSIRESIRAYLAVAGLVRSESWVHRVSRDYARVAPAGMPVADFVATRIVPNPTEQNIERRPDLRYSLSYADPTGETAARNVDRARRNEESPRRAATRRGDRSPEPNHHEGNRTNER